MRPPVYLYHQPNVDWRLTLILGQRLQPKYVTNTAQIILKPLLVHPSNTLLTPRKHHNKIMARSLVVVKILNSTTLNLWNTRNLCHKNYGIVLYSNNCCSQKLPLEFEGFGGLKAKVAIWAGSTVQKRKLIQYIFNQRVQLTQPAVSVVLTGGVHCFAADIRSWTNFSRAWNLFKRTLSSSKFCRWCPRKGPIGSFNKMLLTFMPCSAERCIALSG